MEVNTTFSQWEAGIWDKLHRYQLTGSNMDINHSNA